MFSFERLDVYQKARELVKDVYQLQKQFPVDRYLQTLLKVQEETVIKRKSIFLKLLSVLSWNHLANYKMLWI